MLDAPSVLRAFLEEMVNNAKSEEFISTQIMTVRTSEFQDTSNRGQKVDRIRHSKVLFSSFYLSEDQWVVIRSQVASFRII